MLKKNEDIQIKVLTFNNLGWTAKQIANEIHITIPSVRYWIHRDRTRESQRLLREKARLDPYYVLKNRVRKFQKSGGLPTKNAFNYLTIIEKFGEHPECALTGKVLDLKDGKTYHFDHKIPRKLGGLNELDNLQIVSPEVNYAKHTMTDEDFIKLCKSVVEYNCS